MENPLTIKEEVMCGQENNRTENHHVQQNIPDPEKNGLCGSSIFVKIRRIEGTLFDKEAHGKGFSQEYVVGCDYDQHIFIINLVIIYT